MKLRLSRFSLLRRQPLRLSLQAALFLLLGDAAIRGFIVFLGWFFGLPTHVIERMIAAAGPVLVGWSALAITFYALARVSKYHPLAQRGYRQWLLGTPWHFPMPLPLGPLTLDPADVLPAAIACLQTARAGGRALVPLTLFVAAYSAMLLLRSQRRLGWLSFYAVLLLEPAIALLWRGPAWAMLGILAALAAAAQVGIVRMLRTIPWEMEIEAQAKIDLARRSTTDWRLGPLPPPKPIRPLHVLLAPATVGWWIFCLLPTLGVARWADAPASPLVLCAAALLVSLVRWAGYVGKFPPPISLWGRLWTGYWLIPGYDYVLLAPLMTAAVGIAVPLLLQFAGVAPPLTFGLSAAAVLWCALGLPPTQQSWQLTGHHSPVPPQRRRSVGARTGGVA